MKQQYCLEWENKSGGRGWQSLGYDCPEYAEKALNRKIKSKYCSSAYVVWNYVGNDIPEDEFDVDHFYKGYYKTKLKVFNSDVYIDNAINEMKRSQ